MCGSESFGVSKITPGIPGNSDVKFIPPAPRLDPLPVSATVRISPHTAKDIWQCSTCTFQNPASKNDCCEACGTDCFNTSKRFAVLAESTGDSSLDQRERTVRAFAQAALSGKFDMWECSACTYVNAASHFESCEICGENSFVASKKICAETEASVLRPKATKPTSAAASPYVMAVAVASLSPAPARPESPPMVSKTHKLHIPWDSLKLEPVPFAKGGNGQIFKGTYFGTAIAAKQLFTSANSPSIFEEFKREVSALDKLSHPNILQLFGIALEERGGAAMSAIFMVILNNKSARSSHMTSSSCGRLR
jgi:ribosomal protein L37E